MPDITFFLNLECHPADTSAIWDTFESTFHAGLTTWLPDLLLGPPK
jgi:hypothetical protein